MRNYRNGREQVKCSMKGCETLTSSIHGLCTPHYKQQWYLKSVGRSELIKRTSKERWIHSKSGYVMMRNSFGSLSYEHIILAEKALGKQLPYGAVVHHMSAPDDNHGPFKLVVCPDQAYHMLLHKRMVEVGYGQDH